MTEQNKQVDKEFKLSSWAINNKTTIYVIMAVLFFYGISAYLSMARENFPEVKETKIYISTIYPGNTAEDIEKLITDPIEDKVKTVSNVVKVTSTTLLIPFNLSSKGSVINFSISSAVFPGNTVLT